MAILNLWEKEGMEGRIVGHPHEYQIRADLDGFPWEDKNEQRQLEYLRQHPRLARFLIGDQQQQAQQPAPRAQAPRERDPEAPMRVAASKGWFSATMGDDLYAPTGRGGGPTGRRGVAGQGDPLLEQVGRWQSGGGDAGMRRSAETPTGRDARTPGRTPTWGDQLYRPNGGMPPSMNDISWANQSPADPRMPPLNPADRPDTGETYRSSINEYLNGDMSQGQNRFPRPTGRHPDMDYRPPWQGAMGDQLYNPYSPPPFEQPPQRRPVSMGGGGMTPGDWRWLNRSQ